MKGHWQKEVPAKSGLYWTADRDGRIGNPAIVLDNYPSPMQSEPVTLHLSSVEEPEDDVPEYNELHDFWQYFMLTFWHRQSLFKDGEVCCPYENMCRDNPYCDRIAYRKLTKRLVLDDRFVFDPPGFSTRGVGVTMKRGKQNHAVRRDVQNPYSGGYDSLPIKKQLKDEEAEFESEEQEDAA